MSINDEDMFWRLIEEAWSASAPELARKRPGIARVVSAEDAEVLGEILTTVVVPALEVMLRGLSREELTDFDRVLERKLYELDRAEVQEHTDGSDDGFLYARGFIVGMGRAHYDEVNKDPSMAIMNMEGESLCYLPSRVFEERFGGQISVSGISRESCSKP